MFGNTPEIAHTKNNLELSDLSLHFYRLISNKYYKKCVKVKKRTEFK